jgi:hypothetical protein
VKLPYQAPAVAGSNTLTLPAATGNVVTDSATQTLTNKTLSPTLTTPNVDSAQFATVSGTAPLYAARAWVNFNGTGTVAIRASGNVSSSITDNGAGDYTVNFTTAMPDANYCATFQAEAGGWKRFESGGATTSSVIVENLNTSNAKADSDVCYVAIFR